MPTPQEIAEKTVKIMLENHRLLLTLIGFLIAGLFAYGGRGANALDWRYFLSEGAFIFSGIAVVISFSVAINQARKDTYNAYDPWMTGPYVFAIFCIGFGLAFTAWLMIRPPIKAATSAPTGGVRIDGGIIDVAPDVKLKLKTAHDPATGRVQSIEITP